MATLRKGEKERKGERERNKEKGQIDGWRDTKIQKIMYKITFTCYSWQTKGDKRPKSFIHADGFKLHYNFT